LLFCALAACGIESTSTIEQASTSQCPTMGVVEGIDVYSGNGTIDWHKVKAAGRAFAFAKATQGDYNKQSTFAANWSGMAAAGVMRSAYHFFDATKDGVAQANFFLAELNAAGGMTNDDLPPMLDIECPVSASQSTSQSSAPNCAYTGNSGWAPPATIAQRAFDWLSTVQAATGRAPIIYSYPSWFADVQFTDPRLASYPLFIATYGSCANVPAPWHSAVFWQYSGTGSASGVPGAVDLDRFFGSEGELISWNASTRPSGPPGADGGVSVGDDAGLTPSHKHGGCGIGHRPASTLALVALALLYARGRRKRRR
jgi:lysozyme